jgi:PAS domain S-box-containing protein
MKSLSLNTKMTCVFSLLVIVFLLVMGLYTKTYSERQFKGTVAEQQFTLVSAMADEIDGKIMSTLNALTAASKDITPTIIADQQKSVTFIKSRTGTNTLFESGLFIFSPTGGIIAGTAAETALWTKDESFRESLLATFAAGKPLISKPFYCPHQHRHPVIIFAAPVFNQQGKVIAVLGGGIDLMQDNFLGKLAAIKLGKGGYLYLYDVNRTLITHPDRSRILKEGVPPGANRLFDRTIEGFEGTGETVIAPGMLELSSFKRLKTANWILAANYPLAEVYAPIYRAKREVLGGLGLLIICSIFVSWLFMRYLTAPLLSFARHVEGITGCEDTLAPLDIRTGDEIGTLAASCNRMLASIADHKRALQEQLQFSLNLIENSAAPTFVLNAQHQVIAWNKACEELTGVPATKVIGTNGHWQAFYSEQRSCLADLVIDDATENLEEYYTTCSKSSLIAAGVAAECWLRINGSDKFLAFNAAPIRDNSGKLIAAIETLKDLTFRKRNEEELHKLSQAVEQSPSTVVITDIEGNIEYVNAKFQELTGYTAAEAIGKNPRILKSGETPPEEYRKIWETIGVGKEWRGELRNRKKNGEFYWEAATISPLRNQAGEITHYIALKEDITEKKRLEKQLSNAQRMEVIGTLAAGLAHDFNNSLTAIIGYGSLMQRKLPPTDPMQHYAAQILVTADRAASLTQGLLAYSRNRPANPQPLDMNQTVQRLVKLIDRLVGEDVTLTTNLAEGELIVQADSGQIEQALVSLAAHARDTMGGKGSLRITTSLAELAEEFRRSHELSLEKNYAMLAVSDNGPGLDNDARKRLFELFFAAGNMGQGSGIGLSIVDRIVKQHNGAIDVVSSPGQGTTFMVYLPLATPASNATCAELPLFHPA